jgi:predicted MFS family arabinose efflux permease
VAPRALRTVSLRLPWRAMAPSLAAYFVFAMGYIVYITFLVAWMREHGAGTPLVTATWAALGIGSMLSPFAWRRVLANQADGRPLAYANAATGVGAILPFLVPTATGIVLSAFVFGLSFFNAPASVTAFSRKNLPQAQWGPAVAAYTLVFAIGQTFGPIGAGWLADAVGALSWGLVIAAGVLLAGGLIALLQRALPQPAPAAPEIAPVDR